MATEPTGPKMFALGWPGWNLVAAVVSLVGAMMAFPLATRVRLPGPENRPWGFALLAGIMVINVVLGVRVRERWAKVISFFAAAFCLFMIWEAAMVAVELWR